MRIFVAGASGVLGRAFLRDARAAGIRPQQAEQQLDGGGLAGAVAAEEAVDAAFRHGHGNPVDSDAVAEAAGQAPGFDGAGHGGRVPENLSLG